MFSASVTPAAVSPELVTLLLVTPILEVLRPLTLRLPVILTVLPLMKALELPSTRFVAIMALTASEVPLP